MGKGYATRLDGKCINNGADSGLVFLKTVNYHIVYSSPTCSAQTPSGFFACGSSDLLVPPVPGTQGYPINYTYPSGSMVPAYAYGKSSDTIPTVLTRLDGEPVYFSQNDIAPWKPRFYCPSILRYQTRQGPAFPIQTAFGNLARRSPTQGNYTGRQEYDFVDAGLEVPDAERNVYLCEKNEKKCATRNWLTYSGTGNDVVLPLYTSCAEPFTIRTHYEESGSPAPYNALGQDYLPFCATMNARLEDGTLIGYYSGLCYSVVFGPAAITYGPFPQYLPQDLWNPNSPPKPPVDAHRAFVSVEISTFFRGHTTNATYPLGSPLICKQRYWLYSGPTTGNWRYPFKFMCQDTIYASNPFIITCNIIDEGPLDLTLNLTNQKILLTY